MPVTSLENAALAGLNFNPQIRRGDLHSSQAINLRIDEGYAKHYKKHEDMVCTSQ